MDIISQKNRGIIIQGKKINTDKYNLLNIYNIIKDIFINYIYNIDENNINNIIENIILKLKEIFFSLNEIDEKRLKIYTSIISYFSSLSDDDIKFIINFNKSISNSIKTLIQRFNKLIEYNKTYKKLKGGNQNEFINHKYNNKTYKRKIRYDGKKTYININKERIYIKIRKNYH